VPDITQLAGYLEAGYRELREAAQVAPVEVVIIQETRVVIEDLAPAAAEYVADEAPQPPTASLNGEQHRQEAAFAAQPQVVVETHIEDAATVAPHGASLFSQAWADAFRAALNDNPHYKRTSTHWRAGALSFLLKPSARAPGAAVWLDLHQGECRAALSLPTMEAVQRSAFAIEGDDAAWMRVLRGEIAPLAALMRGDLRLSKGSLLRLLPFTQSAEQLVLSAQRVPVEG
jgi:putative sterol carrier protein